MHLLFSIFIFFILSFAAFSEQGTWNTDDTEAAKADAALSGYDDKELEAQEEEVQLIEKEEWDPMEDPIVIEPRKDEREEEVEESTP